MSNTSATARSIVPGFWTRLRLVLEECGESYEELLERRISRLEAEVERLLAMDGRNSRIHRTKADGPGSR